MSSRGHDRERAVKKRLEAEGWWVARAAGSLGDADLVALRPGLVDAPTLGGMLADARLIEVKATHRGPFHSFGPADRERLLEAAELAGAEAWLAWWPRRKPLRWIPSSE